MMIKKICSIAIICFSFFCLFSSVNAQASKEESKIVSIKVDGNLRIEAETVISYIVLRKGMVATPERIDDSLKVLFSTALFSDVSIFYENGELLIKVVENPIINRIIFEGNKKIKEEDLQVESVLRPRQIYTRSKVKNDVLKFVQLYRRIGKFSANIDPKIVQLPQNRVDIIFEIQEGKTTTVRSINFSGNKKFTDRELRGVISTTESRLWKFLSSSDRYDPDRVLYDRELLRQFYTERGYADFRVLSSLSELTRDSTEFFTRFNIEEGQVYKFGETKIDSQISEDLSDKTLLLLVQHQVGKRYNAKTIDKSIDSIVDYLGKNGYAFVNVRPKIKRDKVNRIIRVTYRVAKGQKTYVERININNNTRTQDRVIRRQISLSEGDVFNRTLLSRTERNLKKLGYFSGVELIEQPASEDDKVIIDVNLQEQSTGEISFGAGFSSADGISTQFGISERNFLGTGKKIKLSGTLGSTNQKFNASFADSYFLGRNLYAGIDIFHYDEEYSDTSSLESLKTGIGLSFGAPVGEDSYLKFYTRFFSDEFNNDDESTNYFLPSRKSNVWVFGYSYSFDKRDQVLTPTAGWSFVFSQEIAGPLGDRAYLKTTMKTNIYQKIVEDWILHTRLEVGGVYDYLDNSLDYVSHFFIRDSQLRGFGNSGVGSRDLVQGYDLGVRYYITANLQVKIPNVIPEDFGISPYIFIDQGFLGKTDVASENVRDNFAYRASCGISLAWKSPFGPVRFDFALPIVKESYDKTQFFRFAIGTSF